MTKIEYSLYSGVGEWRAYVKGDKMLQISLPDAREGNLTLGGMSYPIKDGLCIVNTSLQKDGVHPVKINTGNAVIQLEPITIERGYARPSVTEDRIIRRLCQRLEEAERQIERLTATCLELQEKMGNRLTLF